MAAFYRAFLSYSHAADGKLASALQRGIQRLGKPWWRRPVVRVFRDETSLSADPGLWSGIQRALEKCEYFLLMASAQSAASPWVQKEVEWWFQHRSAENLLIIVTDGEIAWNSRTGDFDWDKTTCLPQQLRGRFSEEPHYVDLRWARNRKFLSLRNSRFRADVLTLAAPLHGKPMDELDSEDIRQQRWFRIIASATAIILVALAIISVIEQRSLQDDSAKAESRSMAARSVELLERKDIVKAILVAVLAWRISHTDEAWNAIERLNKASEEVATILGEHTGSVESLAFSPAAEHAALLATGGRDGLIMLWHVPDGTSAGPPIASGLSEVEELQFSDDGSRLLSIGEGTEQDLGHYGTIILHDLKSKTRRQIPANFAFGQNPSEVSLSPNGRLVAMSDMKKITVWDAARSTARQKVVAGNLYLIGLHFATDSRLLFVLVNGYGDESGPIFGLWDLGTDRFQVGPLRGDEAALNSTASFSSDGLRVVIYGISGGGQQPRLFTSGDDLKLQPLSFPGRASMPRDGNGYSVSFDGSGKRVAVSGEGKTVVWDLAEQKVLLEMPTGEAPAALSPDGRWLALAGENVMVRDMSLQNAQAPARTLDTTCSLTGGNNQEECIWRLCEKVSPLITDKALSEALGRFDYDRLKQTPLREPCARR